MFGDLGKIMKVAGEMKKKMPELKAKLAASEFTADAGGGMVTAKVNGKLQLLDLQFSDALRNQQPADWDMVEDLTKAAIAAAQAQAAQAAQAAMKELTGGMDVPGLSDMM